MKIDLRGFLPNDRQIDKQLSDLLKRVELLRIKLPQNVKITLLGEVSARDVATRFYDLAQTHIEKEEYRDAIKYFDDAIRHKSDYFEAYLGAGRQKQNVASIKQQSTTIIKPCVSIHIVHQSMFREHLRKGVFGIIGGQSWIWI
ncbi:MAG: hypothetical protein OXM61_07310 [Candidatus Poribacteria bacterium]|nr:hypothetical protein [Candidatus Poribacteria bacterium]